MKQSLVPYALPLSERDLDDLILIRSLREKAFKEWQKTKKKGSRKTSKRRKKDPLEKLLASMPEHLRAAYEKGVENGNGTSVS